MNYVHYYPRVELEVCKSDVDAKALDDYFRFANDFDGQARDMNYAIFIHVHLNCVETFVFDESEF